MVWASLGKGIKIMTKISIRVIDNITMDPIYGARVFACKNTGKEIQYEEVFMNRLTDTNGVAEVEVDINEDIDIFIRVRCANYEYFCLTKESYDIVDKEEGLFTTIEVQEDIIPPDDSRRPKDFIANILGFLKYFLQEIYDQFF